MTLSAFDWYTDSCPMIGFQSRKSRSSPIARKIGVDTDKYGLSIWRHLVTERKNPLLPNPEGTKEDIVIWL